MRSFAAAWPEEAIVQQVAALLPWGHHMLLLDRAKDPAIRLWYLRAAVEHGWSRNILAHMLKGNLHEREGKALTNFERTLPPPGSDMAEQILRDPYNFDFLTLVDDFKERELERGCSFTYAICSELRAELFNDPFEIFNRRNLLLQCLRHLPCDGIGRHADRFLKVLKRELNNRSIVALAEQEPNRCRRRPRG
jgi:hypothetical protein